MSSRQQIERVQRERMIHDRAGHEGGWTAPRPHADHRHPDHWPAPRSTRTRLDDDEQLPRTHRAYAKYQHHDHHHGHHAAPDDSRHQRARHEKLPAPAAPARKTARRSYMLALAGRQVRFGPVAFWTVVGTLVIMAGWSIVTATYFAFSDDVITRLIARQADLQAAYEDRLAEMRAQVDRVTTRQLLDQEQFEQRLEQVMRRQSVLEQRASTLGSLTEPTVTGSTKAITRRAPTIEPTPKAAPMRDTVAPATPHDRNSRLDPRAPAAASAHAAGPGLEARLARVTSSLDRVEERQAAALHAMEESYEGKARHIRDVLAQLGVSTGKAPESGVGGPYVPPKAGTSTASFERQVHRIQFARTYLDRLHKTLAAVPVRQPVSGEIDTSSSFGMRVDPFLGRPAMHTGIDFRGDAGEPIRVTAAGKVLAAGWSGGYGRMVEVDHGNGLVTRYGHLSQILVQVGQVLKIGHVVGRMGSTGRSTGPHLHYETRVDGEAVDPQKFLRAGLRLGLL